MTEQMERDPDIEEARLRMARLAVGLSAKIGTVDAAGTLVGAAAALLIAELGQDQAASYLESVAAGVRGEPADHDCAGHA